MKVRLLFSDRDAAWSTALPWNEAALRQDLAVDTLLAAMAGDDKAILDSATQIILAGGTGDLETVRHRQEILKDCLRNPAAVRELYALATNAVENVKPGYLGLLARYPRWVLTDALDELTLFLDHLNRLRTFAEKHQHLFPSDGWHAFFATITREIDAEFLARVLQMLNAMRPRRFTRLSAELDNDIRPTRHRLHRAKHRALAWWRRFWEWLFPPKEPPNSFSISPRDEEGQRSLERLRDQGIAFAANELAEAKDHVRGFFVSLRAELAFYVGCVNLRDRLRTKGEPICVPTISGPGAGALAFRGLYDVGLSLTINDRVIGNTASFSAALVEGLVTHYKREEDAFMQSGKFDEELKRMSDIVDHLGRHALVLLNESFAATNEREGSEIAYQITDALIGGGIRLAYVTHLFDFAGRLHAERSSDGLFLRAGRREDGKRAFQLFEGEPLPTSFAEDIYLKVFERDA